MQTTIKNKKEKSKKIYFEKQITEFIIVRIYSGTKTLAELLIKLAKSEIENIQIRKD